MVEENVRPWGRYDVLYETKDTKTKVIAINPGEAFSLQYHKERDELWIIISGRGKVTLGREKGTNASPLEMDVSKDADPIIIPKEYIHRAQAYDEGLVFIEVQRGNCREDDIVRLDDRYNRK